MSHAPSSERYDHVDAMRAIAALLVLCFHAAEYFSPIAASGQWTWDIAGGIGLGKLGVTLFFIISGFVIPASLHEGRGRAGELRVFAIRRFFRLYPLFWASIPFGLLLGWIIWGKSVSFELVLANITMAPIQFGQEAIEAPYWTLFQELLFYALCALLFAFGLLHRPLVLAIASAAGLVIFLVGYLPGVRTGAGPLFFLYDAELSLHLSVMFAGALLRHWYDGRLGPGLPRALLVTVLTAWIVLPLYAGSFLDSSGGYVWVYPGMEGPKVLAVALFLILCFWLKPNLPGLPTLGRISYSIYLVHWFVMYGLLWLAQMAPGFEWLRADVVPSVVAVLVLTVGISFLTYRFIEVPMIDLGRRLSRPAPTPRAVPQVRLHA